MMMWKQWSESTTEEEELWLKVSGVQGLNVLSRWVLFMFFPCIESTGMTSYEFSERLLMEEKVAVVPGTAFGECGEGYVRSCYASSMDNIIEAMKELKDLSKEIERSKK